MYVCACGLDQSTASLTLPALFATHHDYLLPVVRAPAERHRVFLARLIFLKNTLMIMVKLYEGGGQRVH